MKSIFLFFLIAVVLTSCEQPRQLSSTNPVNWEKKMVKGAIADSLESGSTFLSIYSQIFLRTEKDEADLTATVSLHNPNIADSVYINSAIYYNTEGRAIRTYIDKTIFIKPMETVQIVIDGLDNEGGTGANFIFDWQIKPNTITPLFEAVMISTYGQQGISFVTEGKRLK
ncbi:DUF3124 domain-containing protein [Patiriisocius hiemis]|uniref:DUF3124 domain-containing protein n=1 Tax=Patiriisocius hiemis TaxID=3075604 RepID=A0ABU2Y9C8_9FLAO|nr:DUF3124 domain-containing protein [Constantimarinum sp. W242]MDT0554778.1 DUF3124 domain-containing protein [Constantimarinum sp. W242]